MVIELALAKNPNMLKAVIDSKLAKKGDNVCLGTVSLKNYLSLDKRYPKFGENSSNRTGEFLAGLAEGVWSTKDTPDSGRITKFGNMIFDKLKITGDTNKAQWWKDANDYQKEIQNIVSDVEALGTNMLAVDQAGDEGVKTNPLQTTIQGLVKSLKKNHSLPEQFDLESNVGKALAALGNSDLTDTSRKDFPQLVTKDKKALANYLINAKKAHDLKKEQGNKVKGPATKHLISEMWLIGGSDNNFTIFDTRGLLDQEMHSAYQNGYLTEALEGAWNGTWNIEPKGSTVSIVDPKRTNVKLRLSSSNRSGEGFLSNVIKEVNMTAEFARASASKPLKGASAWQEAMDRFVGAQQKLLEDLLARFA
jgi:hypothetical protein